MLGDCLFLDLQQCLKSIKRHFRSLFIVTNMIFLFERLLYDTLLDVTGVWGEDYI